MRDWPATPQPSSSGPLQAFTQLMGTFFYQIPLRTFGLGMEVMSRALEGMQRITEQGAEELVRAAVPGTGAVAGPKNIPTFNQSPELQQSSVLNQETRFNQEPWWEETTVQEAPRLDESFADPVSTTAEEKPQAKEDPKMSCCDQDLSGCELKVVQYTIVSADPYIEDWRRVLTPQPLTIATTDDLTDADFTAWVIAKYIQEHPDKLRGHEKQYLRVCYQVMCRLTMPCADFEKEQVEALRAINRTLRLKNGDDDEHSGLAKTGSKSPAK